MLLSKTFRFILPSGYFHYALTQQKHDDWHYYDVRINN